MAVNWGKGLSALWNGITTGDFSQPTQAYLDRQSMKNGNISSPVGNQFRGLSSLGINATAIAKEDWMRQEQSAISSFDRQAQFNAEQAQIERDFQTYMSNTQYQRAVEDLKKAGLNPILAFSNGGADMTASSSASVSSGGQSHNSNNNANGLGDLLKVFAGLYTAGAKNALMIKK